MTGVQTCALPILLLLLWLAASCSLFLHSHAWLSDCLIARLYLGTLDSRCARPLHRGGTGCDGTEQNCFHLFVGTTHRAKGEGGRGLRGHWRGRCGGEAIEKGQGKGKP